MPKTRTDLINGVLEELRVLDSGQVASAEDTAAIDNRVDGIVADLATRGICYVSDAGDPGPVGGTIEDDVFNYLVPIVAAWCGPKFGQGLDPKTLEFCENRLEIITRGNSGSRRPLTVDKALRHRRRYGGLGAGSYAQGT